MRGEDRTSGALFSYVDVEARIPAKRPLRTMRRLTNAALAELDPRFSALYERIGRPSIPPERLRSTRQTVSELPIRPSPLSRGQPPSPSGSFSPSRREKA
jgi:hypothetical protein